ncbi:MAG: zinc ribbon domain-containing protein [Erysipelotrichaceae bacterium]|nr:zinc ribbon domain-containing protein [Erysipelotrichaceae bacterium]
MYCGNCGNKIKEGEKFCGRCGVPVEQSAETPVVRKLSKQPKVTSITEKSFSINSKILAVISAALLLISMNMSYVSFQIVNWSIKLCDIYDYALAELTADYTLFYVFYVLIFVGIFLFFKLTNHRGLSFIGCVGILVEVVALLFITFNFSMEASEYYSTIYSYGLGLYLHIVGLIVQIVSAIMKD